MIRNIIQESLKLLEARAEKLKRDCPHLKKKNVDDVVNQSRYKLMMLTYIEDQRQN